MMHLRKGKSWPTRPQELLLRATFLPGEEAIQAWKEWKRIVDVDDLDQSSNRLLPQLYRNLQLQGVRDSLLMKFKGVYRQTWYKNQLLFHSAATPLRSLTEAGIEVMILYGAALAVRFYPDCGLHPLADFAILVRPEQAVPAIKRLQGLGWMPVPRLPGALAATYIAAGYAHVFQDAGGNRIRLHWHLLPECCQAGADDDCWQGAVATNLHGIATCALDPTHQLLQVCAQRAPRHTVPLFLRVSDAILVLNAARAEIDWDRLATQVQKRCLLLPVMGTLDYLQGKLGAPVPPAVLQSLETLPTHKWERAEYKLKTSWVTVWSRFFELWFNYWRNRSARRLPRKVMGFPKFLQHFWRLKHLWQVPLRAASAALQQLRPSP